MSQDRYGSIATFKLHEERDTSNVYEFTLDTNPNEALTVSIPFGGDGPTVGRTAMLALYPADSKWPKHVKTLIWDIEK